MGAFVSNVYKVTTAWPHAGVDKQHKERKENIFELMPIQKHPTIITVKRKKPKSRRHINNLTDDH